jgi:hypothetical protein
MNEEHMFTCKECGAHNLRVVWQYETVTNYTQNLECECGKGEDDLAATREIEIRKIHEAWGYLDENHRWSEEEEEEIDSEEEEVNFEVFCSECFEEASSDDWETTDPEVEVDQESYEFYVRCDGCEREIEFGWSHPDRGGRIWTAEDTDFNPWKSWPEPRYRENWAKKGWLRPI